MFDKTIFKTINGDIGFDISKLKIGEQYTFSSNLPITIFKISNYSSNYNSVITANNNGFTTFTFTMSRNIQIPETATQYLFIGLQGAQFVTNINDLANYNMQIEKGSTQTDYVKCKEQVFTFPLGNEKLMLGDYLADDGIHHVRKQVVLDGNSPITSSNYGINSYVLTLPNRAISNETDLLFISSHFKGIPANQRGTAPNVIYSNTVQQAEIRNTEFSTLASFKEWLEDNNPVVEYVLETEQIIPYTSAQARVYNEIKNAYSYDEMTIITGSSDGNKPFFIVQAYKDLNKELNNKVDKVQGKELSSNDFTDTLKEKLEGLENYDDTEIKADISGKQDITDNTLTTINKTVPTAINEVNSIAKLANQAKSYSTYQAFINYLNTAEKTEFIPGQSFMIQTKLVPDLWVYSVENTSVQYTYTTDEDFITYTNQATGGQVGYYKLAQLETQKVDLTDYATKTYVNNLFNSIVDGDEVSY